MKRTLSTILRYASKVDSEEWHAPAKDRVASILLLEVLLYNMCFFSSTVSISLSRIQKSLRTEAAPPVLIVLKIPD